MLVDVRPLMDAALERSRRMFSAPRNRSRDRTPEESAARVFGFREIAVGVYETAAPLAPDAFIGCAVDRRLSGSPPWPDGRGRGCADSVGQALAHVRPDDLDAPCAVFLHRITRQSQSAWPRWRWADLGPYVGDRTPQVAFVELEPEIDGVVVWRVAPIDLGRLAEAL